VVWRSRPAPSFWSRRSFPEPEEGEPRVATGDIAFVLVVAALVLAWFG